MVDLAIVGAGPAGLSAAIYALRAGLDFVLLEQDGCGGGQITTAHQVENYPGLGRISGEELAKALCAHIRTLGVEPRFAPVTALRQAGRFWTLEVEDGAPIQARAVIAATGAAPKALGVPGEAALLGAGVSYCAHCDGAFHRGENVLVVGGGNTAVGDALYLSALCASVTLILRRDVFRAAKRQVEMLKAKENIIVRSNTCLVELLGQERLEAAVLDGPNGQENLPVGGAFLAVGTIPLSGWLQGLPLEMPDGYLPADESGYTVLPGLFVAGDLRQKPLCQVITAAADGANAAVSAAQWLAQDNGN